MARANTYLDYTQGLLTHYKRIKKKNKNHKKGVYKVLWVMVVFLAGLYIALAV